MGRAARANPRSPEGGKPRPYIALHRLWRMVAHFREDRVGLDRYLADKPLTDAQRAKIEKIWTEQHPQPLVTLG